MANTFVTEQAVHSAADALKADGQAVTFRAVRSHLEGGSAREILFHLRTWREKETHKRSAEGRGRSAILDQYLRVESAKIAALFRERQDAGAARAKEGSAAHSHGGPSDHRRPIARNRSSSGRRSHHG